MGGGLRPAERAGGGEVRMKASRVSHQGCGVSGSTLVKIVESIWEMLVLSFALKFAQIFV